MLTQQTNPPIQTIENLNLPRGGDDEPCSPTQFRHCFTMLKVTTSPIHIMAANQPYEILVAPKGYIPHAANIFKPVPRSSFFLRRQAKAIYD